ncbi:hypothetical protein C7I55_19415 [Sphingomonas deserti]|uniref:Uncharacterized protein n=1 Tax=Allosphingosinicella deserti TaxID=2116704 RepID=A0A2P7QIU7_9SPHN|nr:hypothetical protein C7I55_19415 [Sphingomonas deserti]
MRQNYDPAFHRFSADRIICADCHVQGLLFTPRLFPLPSGITGTYFRLSLGSLTFGSAVHQTETMDQVRPSPAVPDAIARRPGEGPLPRGTLPLAVGVRHVGT